MSNTPSAAGGYITVGDNRAGLLQNRPSPQHESDGQFAGPSLLETYWPARALRQHRACTTN